MIRKLAAGIFHGKKHDSHEIAGFRLSEWTYSPDLRFPKHSHERAFFNIVIEGAYSEIKGSEARTYRPRTLVFHPAGEVHSNHIHETVTRIFDLEIEPWRLERAGEHGRIVEGPAEFSGGPAVWLARRLYNEFHRMDNVSPLAIEGLALELLAEASRRPVAVTERQPPHWLRRTRELLHARFTESLSLDQIASAVGVHADHLTHVFRRQYGCTVGDYLRQLRIEFACRQMTTSDTPLIEIALAAGFADQSHFSKTFRRLMGMTPTEFKRHFSVRRFDTTT